MRLVRKALGVCLIMLLAVPAWAQQETPARHALLLDFQTGAELFAKEADTPFPPASMAKMMTVYLIFDQLARGALSLEDEFIVSDAAWRRWAGSGGSLMFLGAGERVTVDLLLKGIIVNSGNDACTVVAEGLAGTEQAFANWMTQTAQDLGMADSRFQNASGWPADDQYTTARDLATLAQRTIEDFPELYDRYYALRDFSLPANAAVGRPNQIRQLPNRNPLLALMPGVADGLKTGHTEEAGYGLTASAELRGRRLVLVVSGLDSNQARARESQRLMNYGFRNFDSHMLFKAGETVAQADVWLGQAAKVPLVVQDDLLLTLSRKQRQGLRAVLRYDAPVPAPIEAGQPLAVVEVQVPDREPITVPLAAGTSVKPVTGLGKVSAALEYLVFGASGSTAGATP